MYSACLHHIYAQDPEPGNDVKQAVKKVHEDSCIAVVIDSVIRTDEIPMEFRDPHKREPFYRYRRATKDTDFVFVCLSIKNIKNILLLNLFKHARKPLLYDSRGEIYSYTSCSSLSGFKEIDGISVLTEGATVRLLFGGFPEKTQPEHLSLFYRYITGLNDKDVHSAKIDIPISPTDILRR